MSTGDVRRPSTAKQTKAVAADGDKPEDGSSGTASKATGAKATGSKTAGSKAAGSKSAGAKAPGSKAAGSKATGSKTAAAKTAASKATPAKAPATGAKAPAAKARPAGRPPVKGAGGGRGRRPVAPVKVHSERNWGPIALFAGAGLVAVLIIGFAAFQLYRQANQPTWQERADGIDGIVNYYKTDPGVVGQKTHAPGKLTYKMSPPVAGNHNDKWQNCMGDVYTSQIANEHAVHSLEHGAVWIAYKPDLAKDEIDKLVGKVRDKEFMMISPYPGLDKPISLQAWGFQLKLDRADDPRIDQFIDALRKNASQEPQVGCSGGITDATGATPIDLPPTGS